MVKSVSNCSTNMGKVKNGKSNRNETKPCANLKINLSQYINCELCAIIKDYSWFIPCDDCDKRVHFECVGTRKDDEITEKDTGSCNKRRKKGNDSSKRIVKNKPIVQLEVHSNPEPSSTIQSSTNGTFLLTLPSDQMSSSGMIVHDKPNPGITAIEDVINIDDDPESSVNVNNTEISSRRVVSVNPRSKSNFTGLKARKSNSPNAETFNNVHPRYDPLAKLNYKSAETLNNSHLKYDSSVRPNNLNAKSFNPYCQEYDSSVNQKCLKSDLMLTQDRTQHDPAINQVIHSSGPKMEQNPHKAIGRVVSQNNRFEGQPLNQNASSSAPKIIQIHPSRHVSVSQNKLIGGNWS